MPSLSVSLPPIFAQVLVIFYCHFEEKRLIINFHGLEICLKCFMSCTYLLMVLCECACANLISKANFNLIDRTELFILFAYNVPNLILKF